MRRHMFPKRWERIDREGSQFFRYEPADIPPKGTLALNYEDIDPRMLRYFPLDFVSVTNDSSVDLLLSISPMQDFTIPQGTIKEISERPITQIRLKNLDSLTTIKKGEIILLFQKLPLSQDRLVRRGV